MNEVLKNEIVGKALDLYRDSLDIKIDVNDFMNVAICTLNAIRELDYRLYKDDEYVVKTVDDILLEVYKQNVLELMSR